jgi:hypothetical protein
MTEVILNPPPFLRRLPIAIFSDQDESFWQIIGLWSHKPPQYFMEAGRRAGKYEKTGIPLVPERYAGLNRLAFPIPGNHII